MENTPRNFALQLGALITLYVSIGSLIWLTLSIITIAYPDTAQNPWETMSAMSTVRYTIAMLVVFFPAYLVLTRLVNTTRRSESGTYLHITKWLIYLSLVVGGVVILGDFVALIMSYLNGELTLRFALKALAVFVITGAAFAYYVLDAKNYWQGHEKQSIRYGMGATLLVILAVVTGFMHTDSPSEVRERNIDTALLGTLADMQSRIHAYAVQHGALPENLENAYNGLAIPTTPAQRAPVTYKKTGDTTFTLCAEFGTESYSGASSYVDYYAYPESVEIRNANDWKHAKGMWCFERTLTQLNELKK